MHVVRAYFLLDDPAGGPSTLVPVLRTVEDTPALARAAMTALLAGPSRIERTADPAIRTAIPAGTRLLGLTIRDRVATVDLSSSFVGGDSARLIRSRLGQVTYTLTQYAAVVRVRFQVQGEALSSILGERWADTYGRASFRAALLPTIFVDRPAWGASLIDGMRVTGVTDVFEAQFRIALLASNGRVLIDRPARATAGSGTWGTFSVPMDYAVTKAQWGILRVYDPSERDGRPESVREYPVYLRP